MFSFKASLVAISCIALTACTTVSHEQLKANPSKVSNSAICNTAIDMVKTGSGSAAFRNDLENEAERRGITSEYCIEQKRKERQRAAAAVAIIAVGATAIYCSKHNCGSRGGYSSYPGNCQYSWQRAADGSRCGRRSAFDRPGGY